MASPSVRDQLVARSVSARYNLFVGLGAVLAVVGLGSFLLTLQGEQADRAWHLFHVNWIYFTGLTGGSFAFVAVQKITKAKWSGVIIRFAEATPFFFFPVSLAGFLLIFTVGYPHIFPEMHGLGIYNDFRSRIEAVSSRTSRTNVDHMGTNHYRSRYWRLYVLQTGPGYILNVTFLRS